MSEVEINPQQSAFVDAYLLDPTNQAQAAIAAGYSPNSAHVTANRLLKNAKIQAEIAKRRERREKLTGINAAYVLTRLAEIDQMDVLDILEDNGGIKPIKEWPKVWRQYLSAIDVQEVVALGADDTKIAAVLKKVKWPDKLRNLELLGKHVDVQAFKEKKEVEHTGTLTIAEAIRAEGRSGE